MNIFTEFQEIDAAQMTDEEQRNYFKARGRATRFSEVETWEERLDRITKTFSSKSYHTSILG